MREAQIIFPQQGNNGENFIAISRQLQHELVDAFGGVTASAGVGGWREPGGEIKFEPVTLFTVAYEPGVQEDARLVRIAERFGALGQQQAVYVRFGDGTVRIVKPQATVEREQPHMRAVGDISYA